MKKRWITIVMMLVAYTLHAQPNCNVYLWEGDTAQYQACKMLTENPHPYYQFSKEFHQLVDSAITICPRFAYAYREKAAPYVKSGNFIEWKKYIDLAVKYDSLSYLPVRASLRYKFFADYSGAIQDIELLERINKFDIGSTSNGTYHLTLVKALCYKQLGKVKEGIDIIEKFMHQKNYTTGVYDNFHLGVMYFDTEEYEKAIATLNNQMAQYNFAEVHYYLARSYKKIGNTDAYAHSKKTATLLFNDKRKMFDEYHFMIDQIFEYDLNNI
jgi:tetratricopeptide (TPR) repeat protein